jgi:hypothetical protein
MADDNTTTSTSNSSNSSNSNHQDGERLRLYRRLQCQLLQEQTAERARRMDELVTRTIAVTTLEGAAALFDSVSADADLHFVGQRPHELGDHNRWPTEAEMWAATANTPPPATPADILALRLQTAAAEDALSVLGQVLAPTASAADVDMRAILRRAIMPITTTAAATAERVVSTTESVVSTTETVVPSIETFVPTTQRVVPTLTTAPVSSSPPPPSPSSSDSPEVVNSLTPPPHPNRRKVPSKTALRPQGLGEGRVLRSRPTKRVRFE